MSGLHPMHPMPPTTAPMSAPVPPAWRLVHDCIAHWAQVQPQAVALASECEQLTFAQLHQRVPVVLGSKNEVERVTAYHLES